MNCESWLPLVVLRATQDMTDDVLRLLWCQATSDVPVSNFEQDQHFEAICASFYLDRVKCRTRSDRTERQGSCGSSKGVDIPARIDSVPFQYEQLRQDRTCKTKKEQIKNAESYLYGWVLCKNVSFRFIKEGSFLICAFSLIFIARSSCQQIYH